MMVGLVGAGMARMFSKIAAAAAAFIGNFLPRRFLVAVTSSSQNVIDGLLKPRFLPIIPLNTVGRLLRGTRRMDTDNRLVGMITDQDITLRGISTASLP